MGDVTQMFKVAGYVLAGVAGLLVVGVGGYFYLRRAGALRGE